MLAIRSGTILKPVVQGVRQQAEYGYVSMTRRRCSEADEPYFSGSEQESDKALV